jgi:DNA-binding transcriptional ArsR family regulator
MATASSPDTNDLFTALGHPLRRRILREMVAAGRDASPRELSEKLDQPLSKLSYHVTVLARCGALELAETKKIRGATQHFYRPTLEKKWALTALREPERRTRRRRR